MKKRIILWLTLLMLLWVTGCTNETADINTPETEVKPESEEKTEPVTVSVYYGNGAADGFEQKEVEIKGLTPQNLIDELAKLNVVSIDTRVKSFDQDGEALKLDLSKDFSQYLNMMGTSGEYIVMGGLVNTFLSAYEGGEILITVEGEVLETGHASYENPLGFFEFDPKQEDEAETENAEPVKYRLSDASYMEEGKSVYYPQFVNMSDEELQNQWNQLIKEIAIGLMPESREDVESGVYEVDYEIASCNTEFVSFVFRRNRGDYGKDVFTLNFDMVNRKNIRLSDYADAMQEAAHNLGSNGYYKILDKELDREAFDEYMKSTAPSADEYKEAFLQYDYDLTDPAKAPYGFCYVKDGKLIIVMYMPQEAWGTSESVRTVEIETGIEVR